VAHLLVAVWLPLELLYCATTQIMSQYTTSSHVSYKTHTANVVSIIKGFMVFSGLPFFSIAYVLLAVVYYTSTIFSFYRSYKYRGGKINMIYGPISQLFEEATSWCHE
jgi:hypothetical protein